MSSTKAKDGFLALLAELSFQDARSNKIWRGFVRDGQVYIQFGRRGGALQERRVKPPYRNGNAIEELVARANKKVDKGYVVERWDTHVPETELQAGTPTPSDPDKADSEGPITWGGSPMWFV